MKKIILIFLIIILPIVSFTQCKEFIKAIAPDALSPYTMDGNFLAPVALEGEEVVLTRTFLAGQKYKISVLGMDFLEKKITIKDEDGFIIFKNYPIKKKEKETYYTDYEGNQIQCTGALNWEFELEQSQNLTIIVKIEQIAKKKSDRMRGCVGIVIGFKE